MNYFPFIFKGQVPLSNRYVMCREGLYEHIYVKRTSIKRNQIKCCPMQGLNTQRSRQRVRGDRLNNCTIRAVKKIQITKITISSISIIFLIKFKVISKLRIFIIY